MDTMTNEYTTVIAVEQGMWDIIIVGNIEMINSCIYYYSMDWTCS